MTAREARLISQSFTLQRIDNLAHMGRTRLVVESLSEQDKLSLEQLGYKITYGDFLNTGIFRDNFIKGFLIEW